MSKSALAFAPSRDPSKASQGEIDAAHNARSVAEKLAIAHGIDERMGLDTGADIAPAVQSRGRFKPAQRPDGLLFLLSQRGPWLSLKQYDAGRKFARYYAAREGKPLGSCLAMLERVDRSDPVNVVDPLDAAIYAKHKLDEVARELNHHEGMWAALESVCGRGLKPHEATTSRRARERLESQLDCALSVLVKLWGM